MTEKGTQAPNSTEYPAAYDTPNIRERRYLWMSRILGFVASLSIILNISLTWAMIGILPLKQTIPFVLTLTEGGEMFGEVKPFLENMGGLSAITENNVRKYIKLRNEIVRSDAIMEQRWLENGSIDLMSSDSEYNRFRSYIIPIFQDLRKNDVTQEVKITAVNAIRENAFYNVEFETIGRGPNDKVVDRARWVAILEVTYTTIENVPYESRLVNPTGFQVVNYTISQKSG